MQKELRESVEGRTQWSGVDVELCGKSSFMILLSHFMHF